MTELEVLRKYNKQGNIQYDFKRKYFTFCQDFGLMLNNFSKDLKND